MSEGYGGNAHEHDTAARTRNEMLFKECQKISDIFSRIGDKWSVYALLLLSNGPMRFGELRGRIDGISQRMLTLTLRALERDGLLTRTAYPVIPPRVEYELTPIAHSLVDVLAHLGYWAIEHYSLVTHARALFDQRLENRD